MAASPNPTTIPMLMDRLTSPVDSEAWRAFVERYRPFIDARCRRAGLQQADVEEVRSRVLASLAFALPSFEYDPARRFRGYLHNVVRNAVRSYWRELSRSPGSIGSGETSVFGDLEDEIELPSAIEHLVDELDERVAEELSTLWLASVRVAARVSPATWRAFWRTALERAPAAVVALETGKSVAAVHVAKCRVIKMLREEMLAIPATA